MTPIALLVCLVAVLSHLGVDAQKEECAKGAEFAYDLENCNKFYTCVGPLAYSMSCSSNLIFSLEQQGCVFVSDEQAKDCLSKAAKLAYEKAISGAGIDTDGSDTSLNIEENMADQKENMTDKMEKMAGKKEKMAGKKEKMADKKEKMSDKKNGMDKKENIEENKDDESNNENVGDEMADILSIVDINAIMDRMNELGVQDLDLFAQDLKAIQENTEILDEHCASKYDIVPHETLCHRYYNCSKSHMDHMNKYLTPYEYECPYPQLFSAESKSCEDFKTVTCGGRMEYLDPCDYAENMCSGPNCKPCSMDHASCVNQPDGPNYWPGRQGSGFWVECLDQRTISQGNCAENGSTTRNIFSKTLKKCVQYSDVIQEVCQWSERRLPHPYECHLFFDCDALTGSDTNHEQNGDATNKGDDASDEDGGGNKAMSDGALQSTRMCPYPLLYSVRAGKCTDHTAVNCGTRREAKAPCDYMPTECVDPSYASCEGLPDGKNVFRTREGTPHFVICEKERTVDKDMCEMDGRGMYKQFSPGVGKCMDV